ncbi:helix-turn-helix transcriptional regulator [Staphylococcus pseudintermedius]|uniref:helix-turn-helix transcriptional regulator n=1 Tax=Staphylococcus pseudintermedius TaxID=283734 RepID=UPI002ED79AC4
MSPKKITNKVYEYRVLNRMTQQELANIVQVSRQTIHAIEKNKYNPSLLLAYQISEAFNEDIHKLFKYINEE